MLKGDSMASLLKELIRRENFLKSRTNNLHVRDATFGLNMTINKTYDCVV